MRIAFFVGTLQTEGDGVARVMLTLARELLRRGHEVTIVTGHAVDPARSPAPVREVPSVVFPLYREYRLPVAGRRAIRHLLDELKPEVVHLHSPDTMSWSVAREARRRGVRAVATHHTDFVRYLTYYHLPSLEPLAWRILSRFYRRMDVVTAPSPVAVADLARHGVAGAALLPWGVDRAQFGPRFRSEALRRALLGEGRRALVLCACRLTWEKDLRTLARVHALLTSRRADLQLVVAGDGPARAEVEALMPGARFLGRLEQRALAELYASAEVFLFPSRTETFGSVTLEALASGAVPVVADAEGSRALVEDGVTGFRVAPGDAEGFADRVEALLDQPALRERLRAAGLAFSQGFAWEQVVDRLLALYLA